MYLQKWRSNKFGNVKTDGRDSKFEADKAQQLELLKKAGKIKDFEEQKRFEIRLNGDLITTYKIDFVVYHNDGVIEYIETKGYLDYASNLRWKMFCAKFKKKTEKGKVVCTMERQKNNWWPKR
jgi:hypothetical protein